MRRAAKTFVDLTPDEQQHVRNALHFLSLKLGGWSAVSRLLGIDRTTVVQSANGAEAITASMVFRIGRVLNVTVDALITGRFPEPGTCPRCGFADSRRAVTAARTAVKRATSAARERSAPTAAKVGRQDEELSLRLRAGNWRIGRKSGGGPNDCN